MYNWKYKRNYRKVLQADGTHKYYISVFGEAYEVDAAVFLEYSQADRRERYLYERQAKKEISLDMLGEKNVLPFLLFDERIPSAEDEFLNKASDAELRKAVDSLDSSERAFVEQHYFDGDTLRAISRNSGIPVMTLHDKKQRILNKLKKHLDNLPYTITLLRER